jgi:hypothetical protein
MGALDFGRIKAKEFFWFASQVQQNESAAQ